MKFWLVKFVLEVRQKMVNHAFQNTLSDLLWSPILADKAVVNILANPMFVCFCASLDAWMKELKSTGKYQVRKTQVIIKEQEDCWWEKGLFTDKNPQQLLDL